jgi:uncharacterized protein
MPLLMCPNDNGPMQTVERAGVQFDMCPTCRGVWLDRGELEKLMEASRGAWGDAPQPPPQQQQPPPSYQQPSYAQPQPQPQPYRGDDYKRDRYDPRYHHKKKRGFDLFDIFD